MQPTAPTVAETPTTARRTYIDVLRVLALSRVVVYHVLGLAWIPVVFPAMGLMFALAGSLMAASLDRSGPSAVLSRLRRLLPALWALAAVAVPVMLLTGWTNVTWEIVWWVLPVNTPPGGGEYGWHFTVVLWYLVTYLWLVVLSPLLLALYRRRPLWCLGGAVILPIAVELGVLVPAGYLGTPAWIVTTYACCWLLGFAYHDGLVRRATDRELFTAVAVLALGGAGTVLWHGLRTGVFDLNHVPVGRGLWSMAFVLVMLRLDLDLSWVRARRRLSAVISACNSRAVTIYLWHVPGGILAMMAVQTLGLTGTTWWISLLIGVLVVTGIAVFLLGWVEDLAAGRPPRLRPWAEHADTVNPGERTRRRAAAGPEPGWGLRASSAVIAVLALLLMVGTILHSRSATTDPDDRQPVAYQVRYVSDLPYTAIANGAGPVERDTTNGDAHDGSSLELDGAHYDHVLAVHPASHVRVHRSPDCDRFAATVAVTGTTDGTVRLVFRVEGDGRLLYQSPPLAADDRAHDVDVDLISVDRLDLIVTGDDEDDRSRPAAVWADARLLCRR